MSHLYRWDRDGNKIPIPDVAGRVGFISEDWEDGDFTVEFEEPYGSAVLNEGCLTFVSSDPVRSPDHYKAPNGVELFDVIGHLNYARANAIKYLFRAGVKNVETEVQDLEKARECINLEIRRLTEQS